MDGGAPSAAGGGGVTRAPPGLTEANGRAEGKNAEAGAGGSGEAAAGAEGASTDKAVAGGMAAAGTTGKAWKGVGGDVSPPAPGAEAGFKVEDCSADMGAVEGGGATTWAN